MAVPTSRWIAVLLFACISVVTSRAQAPPKPGDVPDKPSASSGGVPYVLEEKAVRVTIRPDGQSTRLVTLRVRINDDLGVRQWGQLPLPYMPASETLRIVRAEVIKPNGSVVTVGPEAVQDFAVQEPGSAPVFVDLRQKHVTVPSLRPDDTLLLVAEWSVEKPLAKNHSWFEYSFTKDAIVTDERLEIEMPSSLAPIVKVLPTAPVALHVPNGDLANGRRLYRWQTSNPKLPEATKDGEEPEEAPSPEIRITTFRDWSALGAWIGPLMQPQPDAAVKAKAEELTRGLTSQDAKIRALYAYVATHIRYVSLSFGLGRIAPHAPGDVLRNLYGDCKDKHTLLAALLDTIGVRAVPVLLNTTRSIADDVPSPTEFDHVLTAIPTGADPAGWTWLDTTLEVAPFGLLSPQTRNRRGFIPASGNATTGLVTTPADGPFPFVDEIDITGVVNPLGVLHAKVVLRLRGDSELYLRTVSRALPAHQVREFGENFAKATGFSGSISNFQITDPLATAQPFEISFAVRQGGYLDWATASAKLNVPVKGLSAGAFESAEKPVVRDRLLGTPSTSIVRLTLDLPAGYVAVAPVGASVEFEGFAYRSTYAVKDSRITAERRLGGAPRTLIAAKAAEYVRVARAVTADLEQTFEIKRTSSTRPEIPEGLTANELYHAAYVAYTAKDYESARILWTRNTEVDPKMVNAWSGLGSSLERLKRYDEAIAAYERQVTLDPSSKQGHKDLARVLDLDGALTRSAAAYERHLQLSPADGESHRELAEVYLDLDDAQKALAPLERAAELRRQDEWVQVLLGATYLDLKQGDRALAAFDRALAISKRTAVTTRIAWELASVGGHAKRARTLAEETIADIAARVNVVPLRDVNADHHDLMERLAWCWDALGLLERAEARPEAALRFFDAAWRLGGSGIVAQHMGETYEQMKNRSADAVDAYLISRSLTTNPSPALLEKLAALGIKEKQETIMQAAGLMSFHRRSISLPAAFPKEPAKILLAADKGGRVTETHVLTGSDAVRTAAPTLVGTTLQLTAADARTTRMLVTLEIRCANGQCGAAYRPARYGSHDD